MPRPRPITARLAICAILPAFAAPACQHIKGVVLDSREHPITTAVLSVGRPDAIAVPETHKVDSLGRFDFQLSAFDATNLYVYEQPEPQSTLRRLDPNELSDHMRIIMPRIAPNGGDENILSIPPGVAP